MKKELTVSAIKDGTVIDHIPSDATFKVADILNLKDSKYMVTFATNLKSKSTGKKGIVKIGGKTLTKEEVDKIAVVAPKATLNIIQNYDVKQKKQVSIPDTIKNIVKCSNPSCITNYEKVKTKFYVIKKDPVKIKCQYCERSMISEEIEIV